MKRPAETIQAFDGTIFGVVVIIVGWVKGHGFAIPLTVIGAVVASHDRSGPADPACAVAHGEVAAPADGRTLVAVFASAVGRSLLHFARDTGFRTVLVEPEPARLSEADRELAGVVITGADAARLDPAVLGKDADVVVTDHHRAELGPLLREVLAGGPRWVGVIGSPRHTAPHVAALAELGVLAADIARVHRPIGLNIGSRTPPEIALAALAGLIADRNGRPAGFEFPAQTS